MRVVLAPMEGVVDHLMRDMLTRVGGFDLCVTEFIRVTQHLLSEKVFLKYCPELANGARTPAGVPVRIQLLGSDPYWLAQNAVEAVKLGSPGIDLNFGCPAKTVNKSMGGAVLLKDTQRLYDIVKAVRDAVPQAYPVTAKIRLGYDDKSLAVDNAQAIAQAGATSLAVHARTKLEGYKPPAHWQWINKITQAISIPVVANGEIWNLQDALACQQRSNCTDLMIGRGALAMPNLARVIKQQQSPMEWQTLCELLLQYSGFEIYGDKGRYYPNRVKQWLKYIVIQYPQAQALFESIRVLRSAQDIVAQLRSELN
jgi:tRNA-dihydrouridine synthase C